MTISEIMEILPHRYPMLLIDRIVAFEPMVRANGYKNVTLNEPFFQGHFPGAPLMPGVFMIEALAQLGGTIIMNADDFRRRTPFLAGIDKAKFRRPVIPGDRLDMETTLQKTRSNMGWVSAIAKVDGKLACSADLMFSLGMVTDFHLDAAVLHE
ncbi:MAG: 3-hydroxyacyl-ACP dehydratase FabZ [Candidatus Eremiobacteraeota bacterium]|nr:3-hydroxyacyl-ACP dehydratase FabZ [Candidatus Eremiobacteraeota bacterium]